MHGHQPARSRSASPTSRPGGCISAWTWGRRPYWVEADVARLQQVFWNLLKNAIKFTPHGGCVGVRCRPEAEARRRRSQRQRHWHRAGGPAADLQRLRAGGTLDHAAVRRAGPGADDQQGPGGDARRHDRGPQRGPGQGGDVPRPAAAVGARSAEPRAPARRPTRQRGRSGPCASCWSKTTALRRRSCAWCSAGRPHRSKWPATWPRRWSWPSQQRFDLLISDLGLPDGSGHDLMRQLRAARARVPRHRPERLRAGGGHPAQPRRRLCRPSDQARLARSRWSRPSPRSRLASRGARLRRPQPQFMVLPPTPPWGKTPIAPSGSVLYPLLVHRRFPLQETLGTFPGTPTLLGSLGSFSSRNPCVPRTSGGLHPVEPDGAVDPCVSPRSVRFSLSTDTLLQDLLSAIGLGVRRRGAYARTPNGSSRSTSVLARARHPAVPEAGNRFGLLLDQLAAGIRTYPRRHQRVARRG